jgi:SAM-dependent methyltransferase
MTLNRHAESHEKRVEKPDYGSDASQNAFMVLAALMWMLPQLVARGNSWALVPAVIIGGLVVWGGVTTAIGSMSWYRTGLDRRLIDVARAGTTCRVLNAFCGTGSLAVSFGKTMSSGEVVATDRWRPRKRVPDPAQRTRDNIRIEGVGHIVRVQEADPLALPFKAGYFNAVGSRYGISGVRKDRQKVLLETLRVMKPGGRLVLAESVPVALWLRYRVLPPLAAQYRVSDVRLSRFHFTPVVSATKLS